MRQDHPRQVDGPAEQVGMSGGNLQFALAEKIQQRLGFMRQRLDINELQISGATLHRVEQAKDRVYGFGIELARLVDTFLQLDELRLDNIKQIKAFNYEIAYQFGVDHDYPRKQ